ncbi:hypothetical protein EMPG_13294 [Blastomyces silverae]|uniref:Uncharacterized protein n=1 Tax=Blastomyces silverae TaxID=2060906 RepID=A0A0H1BJ17_9EURO|nr:hypothetical protein EMPG_13294 [Blastomyces silverae]
MSHPKTYFILPTTAYAPDDLIRLGQVIVNPRIPYRRLAEPLPLEGKLIPRKAAVVEWSASKVDNHATNAGIFAHFRGLLDAEASSNKSQIEKYNWEGALLETHFIELDEDPEYVFKTATEVPAVLQWLEKNWPNISGRMLYMITGIKTASTPGKATYDGVDKRDVAAKLKATAPLHPGGGVPAKLGAEAGYHNSGDIHLEGTPQDSFVFAYQLRKIHIDWRRKTRLGDHVGGADLHGEGPSTRIRGSPCQQNREEVADYEIDSATYDIDDFGASLPRRDVKVAGVDESDRQQCLMIQATVG